MAYIVYAQDKEGKERERERVRFAHRKHLRSIGSMLLGAGALLSDDGTQVVGGLSVINYENSDEANQFARQDPYDKADIRQTMQVQQWDRWHWSNKPIVGGGLEPYVIYIAFSAIKSGLRSQHEEYLRSLNERLQAAGVVRNEKQQVIGELSIIYATNKEEVERFIKNDPYQQSDAYQLTQITRWRCRWWEGRFLLRVE